MYVHVRLCDAPFVLYSPQIDCTKGVLAEHHTDVPVLFTT